MNNDLVRLTHDPLLSLGLRIARTLCHTNQKSSLAIWQNGPEVSRTNSPLPISFAGRNARRNAGTSDEDIVADQGEKKVQAQPVQSIPPVQQAKPVQPVDPVLPTYNYRSSFHGDFSP
jgi:hypothetical protein